MRCTQSGNELDNTPSEGEINIHDSLDERRAARHFLGKTRDQARALFEENSIKYYEDLLWMGPIAFNFYICSAYDYLSCPASADDGDFVNGLLTVVETRVRDEPGLLDSERVSEVVMYVAENYGKFAVDPSIYGSLKGRYLALGDKLSA